MLSSKIGELPLSENTLDVKREWEEMGEEEEGEEEEVELRESDTSKRSSLEVYTSKRDSVHEKDHSLALS